MFSSPNHLGSRRPSATTYRDVNASTAVEGASPHKLVSLLFQTLAREIAAARGGIARGDVAAKGRAIGHAVRVVEEGLLAPLDLAAGGPLAANLRDLYEYLVQHLTLANLKSDDALLAECARLVDVLREGWDGIANQVGLQSRAAA
jgi:flagellar protein FliS